MYMYVHALCIHTCMYMFTLYTCMCNYLYKYTLESRFKEKHSLDSDEEDDNKEEECQTGLDDEDLAAQEDTTIVSYK